MPLHGLDDSSNLSGSSMKRYLRVCWLRFKWRWLGFNLTTAENSEIVFWITRNVTNPSGLNAHDVCELEWEREG